MRLVVEAPISTVLFNLPVHDEEVQKLVIQRLVESWEYTVETKEAFIKRIGDLLSLEVKERERVLQNYNGTYNHCRDILKSGRKVNTNRLPRSN